jgi:hypothetical protein
MRRHVGSPCFSRAVSVFIGVTVAVTLAGCNKGKPASAPSPGPLVVTASATPGAEPLLSLVEKGAVTYTRQASGASPSVSLTFNWEERGSGREMAFYHAGGPLTFFLRGVVRIGATPNAPACSANVSALPRDQNTTVQVELPSANPSATPSGNQVEPSVNGNQVEPSASPIGNYRLSLSSPGNQFASDGPPQSFCNMASTPPGLYQGGWEPGASDPAKFQRWQRAARPVVEFPPASGPTTQKFSFADSLSPTERTTLKTAVTFTSTATPTVGPEAPPKVPQAVKDAARDAARAELGAAVYPCATSLAGASIFGVMGPAIGPITGGTMIAVAGPVCANQIVIINNLARTVVDPPVADYTVIARVPTTSPTPVPLSDCSHAPAADRAYCTRLHAAAQAWAAAIQHEADVTTALSTTVGRVSAASSAGDVQAATAQVQAATALMPQLATARQNQDQLGAALAAIVKTDHADGAVTAATTGSAYDAIVHTLTTQGVAEADLRTTLGDALTPGPLDVLATLGAG